MQVAQKKSAAKPVTPKPVTPKAEAPKAEAPKKQKKAANKDDEDDEPSYADEKPKGKNPLDELPKSSFSLDAWKRCYSNNDTRWSSR